MLLFLHCTNYNNCSFRSQCTVAIQYKYNAMTLRPAYQPFASTNIIKRFMVHDNMILLHVFTHNGINNECLKQQWVFN